MVSVRNVLKSIIQNFTIMINNLRGVDPEEVPLFPQAPCTKIEKIFFKMDLICKLRPYFPLDLLILGGTSAYEPRASTAKVIVR